LLDAVSERNKGIYAITAVYLGVVGHLIMNRIAEILNKLGTKDREAKLRFYERLAFNMTICVRSIWSNPKTTDGEKIEAIKTINELSHRIFNWIWKLRRTEEELIDAECFSDIKSYGQENSIAAGEIGAALNLNYRDLDES